jgi:hypothetical protein
MIMHTCPSDNRPHDHSSHHLFQILGWPVSQPVSQTLWLHLWLNTAYIGHALLKWTRENDGATAEDFGSA